MLSVKEMIVRQTLQLCHADTVKLSAADYPLNYNKMPEVMVYAFLQDDHTSGMFLLRFIVAR